MLVRALAGTVFAGTALSLIWAWWLFGSLDGEFEPDPMLRGGVLAILAMALGTAFVLAPALTAGSLAGERERGSMALLLTTGVNAFEIVIGRLAGKLSQVGMVLLTAVPGVVLLASMAEVSAQTLLTMAALIGAVAFGMGGISIGASATARRGRDALLGSYGAGILLLMGALLGNTIPTGPGSEFLRACSPFATATDLVWEGQLESSWVSIAIWTVVGAIGFGVAVLRLRPVAQRQFGGEPPRRGRGGRRWFVPPVGERPMLWKELFIERVGTLGKVGRWVGHFLVLGMFGASTVLAGLVGWHGWRQPNG